jgi:hypothetical protein
VLGHKRAVRLLFIVAELGRDADPFMLHLHAALAEKGRWTDLGANNSGPAGKESEGAKLGDPTDLCVAGSIGRIAQAQVADEFAANLMPLVQAIQNAGAVGGLLGGVRNLTPARGLSRSTEEMGP